VIEQAVLFSGGPYVWPNVSVEGICAYTNNVITGPFVGSAHPLAATGWSPYDATKLEELGYGLEAVQKIVKKVGLPQERGSEKGVHDKGGFLTVGNLAERSGVSPRTIKHWEDKGIIEPDMRSEGGFRLYAESYVFLCQLIRDLQLFGYTLEEVKAVSDDVRTLLAIEAGLDSFSQAEVEKRLAAMLEAIQAFGDFCRENDWIPVFYEASERLLPAYRAAGLRLVKVGEEAIIPLDRFTLQGSKTPMSATRCPRSSARRPICRWSSTGASRRTRDGRAAGGCLGGVAGRQTGRRARLQSRDLLGGGFGGQRRETAESDSTFPLPKRPGRGNSNLLSKDGREIWKECGCRCEKQCHS
jgi:DNA-binding transcriptional MerR regulator